MCVAARLHMQALQNWGHRALPEHVLCIANKGVVSLTDARWFVRARLQADLNPQTLSFQGAQRPKPSLPAAPLAHTLRQHANTSSPTC